MAIDKAGSTSNILLTAQIIKTGEMGKTSESGAAGGGGKAFWNVSSSKGSIFEAARDITKKTGDKIFVAHNQILIFGKEIAADGIGKYIDFYLRAHEMRPTTLIVVARDSAAEILNVKPELEKLPAMNIAKIVKAYGFTSQFVKVNLQDLSSRLMSKTTSPIAPLIEITTDSGEKDVYVSGMAVFKKDKMVGILNKTETRGLLWVTNKVKSGVIEVTTPEGEGKALLEINIAKSKVTPEIKNGKITMKIEIKEESSLVEQTTPEILTTVPAFKFLQKEQEEIIRKEIIESFDKSKQLNCDFFGFGDLIHKKYQLQWKEMEDKWDEIYPSIVLIIKIESKVIKTDLITNPAVPEKDEKK